MAKFTYYDIEAINNVFCIAIYNPDTMSANVFILVDPADKAKLLPKTDETTGIVPWQKCVDTVRSENRAKFADGKLCIYDLHHPIALSIFARTFGVYDPKMPDATNYALVRDTDFNYNEEEHPFLLGYNSFNYDTTMLAIFEKNVFVFDKSKQVITPRENLYEYDLHANTTLANQMREWSDLMFTDQFKHSMPSVLQVTRKSSTQSLHFNETRKYRLRQSMLNTGRYIDVARLNEKQEHRALKRQLASIGCQIKEFNKLNDAGAKITTSNELAKLISYNISDVVNLCELFNHPVYQSAFSVKSNMLKTYPELVYSIKPKTMPVPGKTTVRRNRLFRDSSSQQLTSRSLCPDGRIPDDDVLSFAYPRVLSKLPNNICEQTWQFAQKCACNMTFDTNEVQVKRFLDETNAVLDTYRKMEGVDFNTSPTHTRNDKAQPLTVSPIKLSDFVKDKPVGGCILYYDSYGNPSSCYASFSIGGIHGAEYNKALYDQDLSEYQLYMQDYRALGLYLQELYRTTDKAYLANALRDSVKRLKDPIEFDFPSGRIRYVKDFLAKTTKGHADWKRKDDLAKLRPHLFNSEGNMPNAKLNPRYTYTSAGFATHEDFASYYPNLLRQMNAFSNPNLGYDRYGEMFNQKQELERLMRDETLTEDERRACKLNREGVKLILNTASGAGDADFDNPVRANNKVLAMRSIGQMFTWRIAQAQALNGSRIISTNTDGIYVIGENDVNVSVLKNQSADIGIKIEPELIGVVSKDSNNRVEFKLNNSPLGYEILGASGASLRCFEGPSPACASAHPAILDAVLAHYLIQTTIAYGQDGMSKEFDMLRAQEILHTLMHPFEGAFDDVKHLVYLLLMFQNVICASVSAENYPFACTDTGEISQYLDKYTRAFYIKENADLPYVHIQTAAGRKVTPVMQKTRLRDNLRPYLHDARAIEVIAYAKGLDHHVIKEQLESNIREAIIKKIANVDPSWHIYIENSDLHAIDITYAKQIIDSLDLNIYLNLVKTTYENSWQNKLPNNIAQ